MDVVVQLGLCVVPSKHKFMGRDKTKHCVLWWMLELGVASNETTQKNRKREAKWVPQCHSASIDVWRLDAWLCYRGQPVDLFQCLFRWACWPVTHQVGTCLFRTPINFLKAVWWAMGENNCWIIHGHLNFLGQGQQNKDQASRYNDQTRTCWPNKERALKRNLDLTCAWFSSQNEHILVKWDRLQNSWSFLNNERDTCNSKKVTDLLCPGLRSSASLQAWLVCNLRMKHWVCLVERWPCLTRNPGGLNPVCANRTTAVKSMKSLVIFTLKRDVVFRVFFASQLWMEECLVHSDCHDLQSTHSCSWIQSHHNQAGSTPSLFWGAQNNAPGTISQSSCIYKSCPAFGCPFSLPYVLQQNISDMRKETQWRSSNNQT